MGLREHFWELRKEIKANFKDKKLKEGNFLEKFWVPLDKIETDVLSQEEFKLEEAWKWFKRYKVYKNKRDEFVYIFSRIKRIIIDRKSGEKEEEAVKKVLEKIEERKGELIREYYENFVKSKKIFLFVGIKKKGYIIEISYFVGDSRIQKFKSDSWSFHRVPEGAVSFHLTPNNKNELVPQYVFEFPYS